MEDARKAQRREVFVQRRGAFLAGLALMAALLFWATGRCRGWEAATLGFPLILFLAPPPAYYMCCVVPIGLLAVGRPILIGGLLATLAAWCMTSLALYETADAHTIASAFAVGLGYLAVVEAGRRPRPPPTPRAPAE